VLKDKDDKDIDFLSAELVSGEIVVSINETAVVDGTYNVEIEFSAPGV